MFENTNLYREIRYRRTYRTLGKMSVWRVVLGILLLCSVLFISGFVSQLFAARGQFHIAETLMISPAWMEQYKPETKAFIEAGVLYQDGEYEAAAEAFGRIEDVEDAPFMENLSYLKLASEKLSEGDEDGAYTVLTSVDHTLLAEEYGEEYISLCDSLGEYYDSVEDDEAMARSSILRDLKDAYSQSE